MAAIDPVETLSIILYGFLGIACVVSVLFSLKESDTNRYRIQQWFHLCLGSFVFVRVIWFSLKAVDVDSVATFVLNRVGFTIYFTVFTLVLFYWVENYHKTYVTSREFLPRFFWVFVATNFLLYLYEAIIVIIFVAGSHEEESDNPVYELSIYTIIALSFAVSLSFGIYGIRLYLRHRFARDWEEDTTGRFAELIKVFICTIIFCLCFLSRGVAFLYRPVTGKLINNDAFLAFGYFIPELIPSFVEFYVIRTIKQKDMADSKFIDGLYQQEEDLRDTPDGSALHLDNLSQAPNLPIHHHSPPLTALPPYSHSPTISYLAVSPSPYHSPTLTAGSGVANNDLSPLSPLLGASASEGGRHKGTVVEKM